MPALDPLDEDGWINVGSDVVQQDVDKVGLVDGVLDQVVPQVDVIVLLAEVDCPMNVRKLAGDQVEGLTSAAHPGKNENTFGGQTTNLAGLKGILKII